MRTYTITFRRGSDTATVIAVFNTTADLAVEKTWSGNRAAFRLPGGALPDVLGTERHVERVMQHQARLAGAEIEVTHDGGNLFDPVHNIIF